MPIVRITSTRPNTAVEFYNYPFDFLVALKVRHNYDSYMTATDDGLTRVIEMTFATIEDLNNWENDSSRLALRDTIRAYNQQRGITVTTEVLT